MTKIPVYEPFAFAEQLARLGPQGDVTEVLQQPTPEGERARFLKKVLFAERGPDRDLVEADAGMIARLKELAAVAPEFRGGGRRRQPCGAVGLADPATAGSPALAAHWSARGGEDVLRPRLSPRRSARTTQRSR